MTPKLLHSRTKELVGLMKANSLSQVDAARLMGVSRSMVNAWAQGTKIISDSRLRLLKFEIELRKKLVV